MEPVNTPNAPAPGGHYSQAIIHNGLVYVAGQLPIDPETGEKKLGSIEEQTEQILRNTKAILEAAGSSLDLIIKTTVYVADINLWANINKVYGEFMSEHRPARTVVPTMTLHYGFLVEMDVVAALSE